MVVLLLLLQLVIMIPAVQRKIKDETSKALQEQFNSDVTIGRFRLGFPKKLNVSEILVLKNRYDTLLYLGEFSISIKLFPLLYHKIVADKIELKNLKGNFELLAAQLAADSTVSDANQGDNAESEPWEFSVNRLSIESSYVEYRDEDVGFNLIMDIGTLNLHLGFMDFDTLISCKKIEINETNVSYESLNIPEDEDTSAFKFADIRVRAASVENSGFTYIDSAGAILFFAQGEEISVTDLLVDITNEKIVIDKGFAKTTDCAVEFFPENDTTPENYDYLNWGQYLWRVEGNGLELEDYKFTIDYQEEPYSKGHFNNSHMNLYNLTGSFSDFILDEDTLVADLKNLRAKEINGLEILNLNAEIKQDGPVFSISEMNIQTPISEYTATLKTTISPTNYLKLEGKTINLNLVIKSDKWNEIDYFYPLMESVDFLSEDFVKNNFELKTDISGKLNDLDIQQFNFHLLDSSQIIAHGNIKELLNPDSLQTDLNFEKLMTSKNELEKSFNDILPDTSYTLPEYIIVKGVYQGSTDKHYFAGNIESNVGEVNISEAKINFGSVTEYKAALSADLQNLNTIANTGLDKAAFDLEVSFKGEDIFDADGKINLDFDSLTYNNYTYFDLGVSGETGNGQFGMEINSSDTNLLFNIAANGDIQKNKQDIQVDLDIGKIDLHQLDLYNEELECKGKAALSISITEKNNYALKAKIQSLDFGFSDTLYKMHPVELSFTTNDTSTGFHLSSFFYNLDFTADDYFIDVANSLVNLPGYYLADTGLDSVEFSLPEIQITGKLNYPEAFARLFFPGLPAFEKLTINGAHTKARDEINFNLFVPGISYNNLFADSMLLSVTGTSNKLNYTCLANFEIDDLMTGKLNIFGEFGNSELIAGLQYFDTFSNKYIDLTAQIDTTDDKIIVHIIPDNLVFSYDRWVMNPGNRLVFEKSDMIFENFDLSSENQQISISSNQDEEHKNIELILSEFNLGSLEHVFAFDTVVAGKANADFIFSGLNDNPVIMGSLTVDNFTISGFNAGKLNLNEFTFNKDVIAVEMAVSGDYEDISLSGTYDFGNEATRVDANLDIDALDLSDLNYLLEDYIKDAKGTLTGDIKIGGDLNDPLVNGNLHFKEAGAGIISLNNYFTLGNEVIRIKNNVIDFDELSIKNKRNQTAKISGQISFGSGESTYSNLNIKTDNMEILNSTRDDNDLVFGILKVQADITVKGYEDNLKVDANVEIDESTDITYIFPESLAIKDNRGVVRFQKNNPDSLMNKELSNGQTLFSPEVFNDLKTQINIDNGAQFKLFFDSGGKDFLDASINGTMNYVLYESNTEISGMFEIEKGQLHYGIPMVTVEDYKIEPGSFITLSNDIYNPHVNIVASSNVRASTEGLMADYNKVMTFKILLYMNGELNNVKLKFDISPETSDAMVSARLAQLTEQERNINALNLLARGAFVISVHGTEAGGTSMAAAQIDKFYADQLNHLISENVHFVDLHFDVQSFTDYGSSGEQVFRRNYYYNIGKSFLKDRARINYKGSLGLSSDVKAEQVNSNFVQNELEVEMKITKDGTLRGVFFRKDKYEGLLEGEVVETGGGIRIKKNFYSIKDIFTKEEGEKRKRKTSKTNSRDTK